VSGHQKGGSNNKHQDKFSFHRHFGNKGLYNLLYIENAEKVEDLS
jgi:hypothetical protein